MAKLEAEEKALAETRARWEAQEELEGLTHLGEGEDAEVVMGEYYFEVKEDVGDDAEDYDEAEFQEDRMVVEKDENAEERGSEERVKQVVFENYMEMAKYNDEELKEFLRLEAKYFQPTSEYPYPHSIRKDHLPPPSSSANTAKVASPIPSPSHSNITTNLPTPLPSPTLLAYTSPSNASKASALKKTPSFLPTPQKTPLSLNPTPSPKNPSKSVSKKNSSSYPPTTPRPGPPPTDMFSRPDSAIRTPWPRIYKPPSSELRHGDALRERQWNRPACSPSRPRSPPPVPTPKSMSPSPSFPPPINWDMDRVLSYSVRPSENIGASLVMLWSVVILVYQMTIGCAMRGWEWGGEKWKKRDVERWRVIMKNFMVVMGLMATFSLVDMAKTVDWDGLKGFEIGKPKGWVEGGEKGPDGDIHAVPVVNIVWGGVGAIGEWRRMVWSEEGDGS